MDCSPPGSSIHRILQARIPVLLLFSHSVRLLMTPRTTACQASLSITLSWSLLKLMSTELVMPSKTIPSCYPLLPLPSIFPSIRVFLMSRLFPSGGQSIGAAASASVLPMNIQDWFPLGSTSLISLKSKGLSRVSSNTTVQKHSFFGVQSSLWSTLISIHTGNIIALTIWTFVSKVMFLC